MPPDTTHVPRRSRPWYATDSGRAGIVLSTVTVAVLAIGITVIQNARSNDAVEQTSVNRQPVGPTIPEPPRTGEEVIVLTGTAPTPTQLPSTTPTRSPHYEAEGATLPYDTADRTNGSGLDRL